MKVKKLLFVGLCILGLSTWELQAINLENAPIVTNEVSNLPEGFERIILSGDLAYNVGPNAIEVGVSDDSVYIQFNQSFGSVSISLYNGTGSLVYGNTVNTDVQQLVIIPIGNVENGTYTLVLDNINGSAEGDFEHNNN